MHRPKALNALCDGLLADLIHAANVFDNDDNIGSIVITGSEKAFAAGADIKEMSTRTYVDCYTKNQFRSWTDITKINKPTIAGDLFDLFLANTMPYSHQYSTYQRLVDMR